MKKWILAAGVAVISCLPALADDLVLLTTNDTHSAIDSDSKGCGGVIPRKAIIDSVRKAEKNVVLIDAGDMVQGSLYFKYFKGEVEYGLANMMGYDIQILGNHEFDSGLSEMVKNFRRAKSEHLSSNYDFKGTEAEGLFKPYTIRNIGGRKIGFIGLNIDPMSLIAQKNYAGMKYSDAIETANKTAAYLKRQEKCDLVVVVSHIGYKMMPGKPSDIELARQSRDIDIIIGGHTHTKVDPNAPETTPSWIKNAIGLPVLVTQTGKSGQNLGYIKIDLDNLKRRKFDYRLIPVSDRFSSENYDKAMVDFLAPYRTAVDSVNNHAIGVAAKDLPNGQRNGGYMNWVSDFVYDVGREMIDSLNNIGGALPKLDMAIMNVGGVRHSMPKGAITEGQILSTFPFANNIVLISIKGKDIIEAMRVAAQKGGEGISHNVRVVTDDNRNLLRVVIDNKEVEPNKEYFVSTIDYLAGGNDDLLSLANHKVVLKDPNEISYRMLKYIRDLTKLGIEVNPDPNGRFVKEIKIQGNDR